MRNYSVFLLIAIMFLAQSCSTGTKKEEKQSVAKQAEDKTAPAVDMDLFYRAALDGNINIIKIALEKGVDVNSRDEDNRTAMMFAAFNGHTEIVRFLIENGADVNVTDISGRTALMFASSGPFKPTVSELLHAGAELNVVDKEEHWTALMFAASEGQLEIVKTLTENGADVNLKDTDGESAYDFAVSNNHSETAAFLKEKM